jgi:hypothetical protein
MGHDPALRSSVIQREYGIARAASLEGPNVLEVLALQQYLGTGQLVEPRA